MRVAREPLVLIRSITITLPWVTFRFSVNSSAAVLHAGSSAWVPPKISMVPPSTPLSKMYTLQSLTVPFTTSL